MSARPADTGSRRRATVSGDCAALALRIAGYPRVRLYDGSWAEWGNNPALPVQSALTGAVA